MEKQVQGVLGWGVDQMIRRAVRQRFRNLYWIPPAEPLRAPAILVPNHFGWHDGYVMYHLMRKLELPFYLWIQEYGAFPLFGKVGGLPYPVGDPGTRAVTIRKTIRGMRQQNRSFVVFGEGVLHRPGELLPFGRSLELVAKQVPGATVYPVGIHYEMSMHERPECYLVIGSGIETSANLCHETRLAVQGLVDECKEKLSSHPERFQVLSKGTLDVNERMDMRRFFPDSKR